MRQVTITVVTCLAVVLTIHSGSALACCGSCDHDAHGAGHEHAAAAPTEATMDSTQSPEAASFDGSVAPEPVSLDPTRFAIYKATLSDPGAAWNVLPGLAGEQGLLGPEAYAWSIVPQMPPLDDMANMDPNTPYWAAFTIADSAAPTGELEAYTSPGGKYVRAVHRGPYEGLGNTWEKFARHVVGEGSYDDSRPMLENYVSDPGNTAPEDLITHLYIPVK